MSTTNISSTNNNVVHGRFQRSVLARVVDQVRTWNENRIAIRQLNSLSDRLLQDIGIERQNISESIRQQRAHAGVVIAQHHCEAEIKEEIRQVA